MDAAAGADAGANASANVSSAAVAARLAAILLAIVVPIARSRLWQSGNITQRPEAVFAWHQRPSGLR